MAKLFLVRHGETDWNKDHRMMGQTDIPLNVIGREEASNAAADLLKYKFDVIYSSPLKRALETAQIIGGKLGKTHIEISDLILERDFGTLSGKNWEEMEAVIPNWREIDRKQEYDYSPFGGESSGQVKERVSRFMENLKRSNYSTILVVCHGGIVRAIESLQGEARTHIPSGSITEFEI